MDTGTYVVNLDDHPEWKPDRLPPEVLYVGFRHDTDGWNLPGTEWTWCLFHGYRLDLDKYRRDLVGTGPGEGHASRWVHDEVRRLADHLNAGGLLACWGHEDCHAHVLAEVALTSEYTRHECTPDAFVPDERSQPGTNTKMGWVQRAVLDYLDTAPAGFGVETWRKRPDGTQEWVWLPSGVPVIAVARRVYAVGTPNAAQVRAVQRAVQQLTERKLITAWHGYAGFAGRPYTDPRSGRINHTVTRMLYVARSVWTCDHTRAEGREAPAHHEAQEALSKARRALSQADPVAALHALVGPGPPGPADILAEALGGAARVLSLALELTETATDPDVMRLRDRAAAAVEALGAD